ncbi:UbiA family prenyltransferase [Streptomyces halobius]|uniref:UbiA family prenyltransferase n=1 Tax=Streptomyces halobius TaxID=2879846 RepID=A0ABY4MKL7_9ACTN|nr:UbiA family prenyltransferase [Streptomyces halobius]UQA96971.1 UbiA family prenyltransferase [Streptomyces halobius]
MEAKERRDADATERQPNAGSTERRADVASTGLPHVDATERQPDAGATEQQAEVASTGLPCVGAMEQPGTAGRAPRVPSLRAVGPLLRACHPGPTVVVSLLVGGLAVAAGQSGARSLLAVTAVLAGQLSIGWSNDAIDAARDAAVGRRTKVVVAGAVSAGSVRAAAIVCLTLCLPLSFAYGWLAGAVHLLGVAAGWAYNLGLKATVLSWLPYAVGFASLPAFVALGLPGQPWPGSWIVAAAALLGVGAHLANVLPDIAADLATGVHGWPQRLGALRSGLLLPVPLVAATVLLAFGRPGPVGTAGALAVVASVAVAIGGAMLGRAMPRAPFGGAVVVAGVDVAMLLGGGVVVG